MKEDNKQKIFYWVKGIIKSKYCSNYTCLIIENWEFINNVEIPKIPVIQRLSLHVNSVLLSRFIVYT